MTTLATLAAEVASTYRHQRHWYLYELQRVQVFAEMGSCSEAAARKERKQIQRKLVELRRGKYVGTRSH